MKEQSVYSTNTMVFLKKDVSAFYLKWDTNK